MAVGAKSCHDSEVVCGRRDPIAAVVVVVMGAGSGKRKFPDQTTSGSGSASCPLSVKTHSLYIDGWPQTRHAIPASD